VACKSLEGNDFDKTLIFSGGFIDEGIEAQVLAQNHHFSFQVGYPINRHAFA
jgi:hypothetical protein